MYNDQVNGFEFVLSNWSLYFRDKSFPNLEKLKKTLEYKDDTPTVTVMNRLKSYLDEYRKYWTGIKTDTKVKFKFWFTYAAVRDILDNGDSIDDYYKQFGLNDSFSIILNNDFCEWITKVHKTLLSRTGKDAFKKHWVQTTLKSGKKTTKAKEGGYPASYGSDEDEKIVNRLHWLLIQFKKDKKMSYKKGGVVKKK